MKTTELRIGNLIEYMGEVLPICSLHSDDTFRLQKESESIGCFSACNANGVPLTEEWLLKFGFEKRSDFFIHTQNDEYKSTTVINYDNKLNLYKFACQNFWYELKNVHQLQNLYFALTGDELTKK